jgi:single-stranded DNA-binding protein
MTFPDTNTVHLTGTLVAAPTFRELRSGLPVANVKLASISRFLSTGAVAATSVIGLVFYGPMVDVVKPLTAHSKVFIEGELVVRCPSANSQRTSTTTEVVVHTLHQLITTPTGLSDTSTWS